MYVCWYRPRGHKRHRSDPPHLSGTPLSSHRYPNASSTPSPRAPSSVGASPCGPRVPSSVGASPYGLRASVGLSPYGPRAPSSVGVSPYGPRAPSSVGVSPYAERSSTPNVGVSLCVTAGHDEELTQKLTALQREKASSQRYTPVLIYSTVVHAWWYK